MATIVVHINNGETAVEIPVDDLPSSDDLIQFLSEEKVHYYKQHRLADFEALLNKVTDANNHYRDDKSVLISLINAFAAYYIRQGRLTSDKVQKQQHFNQATQLFFKADKIDPKEEITWACKAFLFLFRNEPGRAGKQFKDLLSQNPDNIPALLGNATILFQSQKYSEACALYQKVIRLNPNCPPSVRLGLANCFFKLQQPELCKLALERVLALEMDDEIRAEAFVALAVLAKNEGRWDFVGKYVTEAAKLSPQNSKALNMAAEIYFSKGELNTSQKSAQRAYSHATIPRVQAEACYLWGRCFHVQGDFQNAAKHYNQAIRASDFVLPYYGLGQINIQQREYEKAIRNFEKVLELVPDNYETMKILGSLYASKGETEKARGLLSRAVEHLPEDIEAVLELAQLLETIDYKKARDSYFQALTLMKKSNTEIPKEIWNNIALLHHILEGKSNFLLAETCYRRALKGNFGPAPPSDEEVEAETNAAKEMNREVKSDWNVFNIFADSSTLQQLLQESHNVTVLFNLGRLYEDINDYRKASTIYNGILREHPHYIDCQMRLASIEQKQNHLDEAERIFKGVLGGSYSTKEALLALGNNHQANKQHQAAQEIFESLAKESPYAALQLANIFLQSVNTVDEARKMKCLKWAQDYFISLLKKDKSNIYAANGLAIIHIHHNRIAEGKECLLQIREACGSMKLGPVWINLAHVNHQQKNYETAIRLYQTCLTDFGEGVDENIHLYLAKAYFDSGNLADCKKTLSHALRLRPWDDELWFNLGITMHLNARQILESAKSNYSQMKAAIDDFQSALTILDRLTSLPPLPGGKKRAFSSRQCSKMCSVARANIGEYENKVQLAAGKEAQRQKEQESKLEEAERLRKKRQRQLELEEEEKRNKQRQLEEEAMLLAEKRKELAMRWSQKQEQAQQQVKQKKERKKAKQADNFVEGEEEAEDDNYNNDGETPSAKKRKRKSSKNEKEGKSKKRRVQSKSKKLSQNSDEEKDPEGELGLGSDEEQNFENSSRSENEEEKGYETRDLSQLFPDDESDDAMMEHS